MSSVVILSRHIYWISPPRSILLTILLLLETAVVNMSDWGRQPEARRVWIRYCVVSYIPVGWRQSTPYSSGALSDDGDAFHFLDSTRQGGVFLVFFCVCEWGGPTAVYTYHTRMYVCTWYQYSVNAVVFLGTIRGPYIRYVWPISQVLWSQIKPTLSINFIVYSPRWLNYTRGMCGSIIANGRDKLSSFRNVLRRAERDEQNKIRSTLCV